MASVELQTRAHARQGGFWPIVLDYVSLTKPRIAVLILFSTLAGMWLAAQGHPPWASVLVTLAAEWLAVGASHTLNMVYDRDIDARMRRTANRPLPEGRISPQQALIFAGAQLAGCVILLTQVNRLTAVLMLTGVAGYVIFYTIGLKRRTRHNTVLGGVAGAIPAMLGWTAVTGRLELPALWLFAVVFFWQPPHVWALAFYRQEDFRAVHLPLLPLVSPSTSTWWQMRIYALLTLAASLTLYAFGPAHLFYALVALASGAFYVALIEKTRQAASQAAYRRLFKASVYYLGLLFLCLIVDTNGFGP